MNYNEIIMEYCPNASERKKYRFTNWLDFFYRSLDGVSPNDALLDQSFLRKMFYFSNKGVSRTQYFDIREFLMILSKYYNIEITIPTHEDVISSYEFNSFFACLEGVIQFIDDVGRFRIIGYNDDFMVIKAIVVLGWHGLSRSELLNIQKEDIITLSQGEYNLNLNGQTIFLNQLEFEILDKLSKANYYHRGVIRDQTKMGKTCYFRGDENFLFRPTGTNEDRMKDYHLTQMIARFNTLAEFTNKEINYRNLKRNALFVEVYNDKSEESIIKKLQRHTNIEKINLLAGYLNQYKKWVELFHSEKI